MTLKSISLISLVMLVTAVPARGQDAPDADFPRAYLTGNGGASFDTSFDLLAIGPVPNAERVLFVEPGVTEISTALFPRY